MHIVCVRGKGRRAIERRLIAILVADIAGYSRLMHSKEDATLDALWSARKDVTDPLIEAHNGRVVKNTGDGFLAEFGTAHDAVSCALAIQERMSGLDVKVAGDEQLQFRIGINLAEIVADDKDIYGDGINIAARIEALAESGGVCITADVYNQVHHRMDQAFEPFGEHTLKNIDRKVQIYRAVLGDKPASGPVAALRGWKPSVRFAIAGLCAVAVLAAVWLELDLATRNDTDGNAGNGAAQVASEPAIRAKDDTRPGIAVLPFDNISNDADQEYFSDGMTEDLITDLSKVSGLFVIARNSVFTYKGKAVNVRQVGRELGVKFVLEGSVRRSGDNVRINAQLIDTGSGGHVWAERYDRKMTDVFALQDEVVQKIVAALAVKLTSSEKERLSHAAQVNPEAYDMLLRGLERLRRFTREDNIEARAFFQRAIELDPRFARAHADLAMTHTMAAVQHWSSDPAASLNKAIKIAHEAQNFDDNVRQVYFVLSLTYRNLKRFDDALAAARHMVSLYPNYADGHAETAINLNYRGQPKKGLATIERAVELNPSEPFFYVWIRGQSYYLLGRFEDAVEQFEKVKQSNSHFPLVHKMLAATYSELGRADDAEWAAAELLALVPDFKLSQEMKQIPYRDQTVLERYIEGLRKAGIKE